MLHTLVSLDDTKIKHNRKLNNQKYKIVFSDGNIRIMHDINIPK